MTNQNIQTQLRNGIEAARQGQVELARDLLHQVLAEEPDNLAAMLWLAFIAATAAESVQLLEHVLALEPDNERAKSGLRWAQARLTAEQSAVPATVDQAEETPSTEEELDPIALRQQLFSGESRNQGRKSVLAHRARRNINPFLVFLILFMGGAVATSISLTDMEAAGLRQPVVIRPTLTSTPAVNIFNIVAQLKDKATPEPTIAPIVYLPKPTLAPTVTQPIPPTPNAGPKIGQAVEVALLAHTPASEGEKWIEVDVTKQRVTAWEGNVPVMSFLVSTGLPETPTVLGEFQIYWKLQSTVMSGADYYLPDVPYVMYFYEDFGLHGVYWHHNFGQRMSRGCVNLATDEAKQLFDWAGPVIPLGETEVTASWDNPGTLVVVHE